MTTDNAPAKVMREVVSGPRPLIGVRLPRPMLAALKQIAEAQDRSTPDVVREAVKFFLEERSQEAA